MADATIAGMPGEKQHEVAKEGVRRAKKWLDATTRVTSAWTVYDDFSVNRLAYTWPFGTKSNLEPTEYSYDMGGILHGGDYHSQFFLAEIKKYALPQDQGNHFDKFLAQSYVTLRDEPRLADHFMWITWAPFRSKTWSSNYSSAAIVKAIKKHSSRVFDTDDKIRAEALIDLNIVQELTKRIWMIVISDKQETLVISEDDRTAVLVDRRKRDGS